MFTSVKKFKVIIKTHLFIIIVGFIIDFILLKLRSDVFIYECVPFLYVYKKNTFYHVLLFFL